MSDVGEEDVEGSRLQEIVYDEVVVHSNVNPIASNKSKSRIEKKVTMRTQKAELDALFNRLDFTKEEDRQEFIKQVDLIEVDTIAYTKPIAIVYNPNSGKKRNIRGIIQKTLDSNSIQYQFFESKRVFHTWELAKSEIDLTQFSALVAVGGDGTYHEVVNGMLHRADKVKLPVGYIPNGSGNDTCRTLNSNEVGIALDYIVKGNIFKTDIIKVISDYENEEEIPEDQKDMNLRYCLINSVFGITAKIVHRAIGCKGCCCNPYQMAALVEFCKPETDNYNIILDDKLVHEDFATQILWIANGKFGGSGAIMSPYGIINDGALDFLTSTKKHNFGGMVQFMDQIIKFQGTHAYRSDFEFYRGKNLRIENKNPIKDKKSEVRALQRYAIDGEDLTWRNFVKYETLYNELEVLVNYDHMMSSQKHFITKQ